MTALALFSGGCDSLIAMKLLTLQGITVKALHFDIGFGGNKSKLTYLQNAAKQVGAELIVCDIKQQFFDSVLFTPQYGYGKYFNPCIDCHANMFAQAFFRLKEFGASFVISGEVLGQRPKSQRKEALEQVKKLVRTIGENPYFGDILSEDDPNKPRFLDELLLRPMSAKLLPPSFPEKMQWVSRDKLLDVSGRSRTRQLNMVREWGFKYYENPGGGCLLTDSNVASKLKDLSAHRKMVLEDITLVKIGRYMVLPDGARCVIGRNEEENNKLAQPSPTMETIELLESVGPIGVVESNATKEDKTLAARLTLAYAKPGEKSSSNWDKTVQKVKVGQNIIEVLPYEREKAKDFLFFKA